MLNSVSCLFYPQASTDDRILKKRRAQEYVAFNVFFKRVE